MSPSFHLYGQWHVHPSGDIFSVTSNSNLIDCLILDRNLTNRTWCSKRFYLAAERQLAKESGSIRLASIQARLTQCFYLLTQSRINHCWSTFGTVFQLALAAGLNRSKTPEPRSGIRDIEVECRRRTFWCAYTLDVHLSVVLGRPQLFNDEDIDVEFPRNVEDDQLANPDLGESENSQNSSTMFAPLAHIK